MAPSDKFPKGYTGAVTIGTGGMARVYRARQRNLDRDVAIKQLLPKFARDASIRARFEREARYAAALHHQGIVPIYDFIKEGGYSFMVMEYVDGIDIRKTIQALGALPPQVAGLVAVCVIRALEFAHHRGIVHRDIKPGNVLVSKRGEVKITDFGIAKDPTNPADDLTRTGTALGTPMYMSPEQVLGDEITFRSDIFSFGILLYEMLTGQRPFGGDTEGKVLEAIRTCNYKDVRRVNRKVPFALARVVRKCLRRDPRKRFKSTEILRRRIERYVYRQIPGSLDDHLAEWMERTGLFIEGTRVLSKDDKEAEAKSEVPDWTVAPPLAWRARFVWAALVSAPAIGLLVWPQIAGKRPDPTPTPTPTASVQAQVSPTPTPTPETTPGNE